MIILKKSRVEINKRRATFNDFDLDFDHYHDWSWESFNHCSLL